MKPISTIIVDDDKLAREIIRNIIKEHIPDLNILGEADSVDSALDLIYKVTPEIIFLDINMPDKNGFVLVNEIQSFSVLPKIIFTTSYDKYAINAFKCAAFDYLLKPIDINELVNCYKRYIKLREEENIQKSVDALLKHLKREKLLFNTRTGCFFIDPKMIIYCQADGNYTHIYLIDGSHKIVTINVGEVFSMLNNDKFARISRSIIINLEFLAEINKSEKTCILNVNSSMHNLKYHPSFIRGLI